MQRFCWLSFIVLLIVCLAGSCRNNNHLKSKYRRTEVPSAVTAPAATSTINADTSTTARKLLRSLHLSGFDIDYSSCNG